MQNVCCSCDTDRLVSLRTLCLYYFVPSVNYMLHIPQCQSDVPSVDALEKKTNMIFGLFIIVIHEVATPTVS